MARDLTFKLILNADTNNLTQNLERSSDAAKQMFDRIKQEADRLRQSMQVSSEVSTLVQSFDNARRELGRLSDASEVSAENIQQMGEYGQQAINRMQSELQEARLELNRLSATNATPHDIQSAQDRVRQLERGIDQTRIAVEAYQDAARAASETPPVPTQFQQQISRLVTNLDDVRRSIDETGRSSTHTRQQLEQMARDATNQIQRYEQELNEARLELNRLSATNATPQDIERARQRVRELEAGIGQATDSLRGFENAAGRSTRELEQGANRSETALNKVGRSINVLQGAMAALGIGFGVHELVQIADNFQNISAQVNLVSEDSKELHSSLEGVRQVATRTTSSLEATANLYARINQAGKDLGVTQKQALQITEAINQSIQISGGSAASAEAAITQLIQGLQSGVLRGEEFNSMMEQAPRLTTALADSLNVTKGELRAMAGEGQLTAEVVIKALKEQSAAINEEYKKIPTTIGGALTNLKTNFTMLIGEIDSTNAASKGIVGTLLMLSENLDVLKTLFNDTAQAAAYFSDRLSNTDPSTIESVKNAIITAYDSLKTLISTLMDVGDTINDVFFTGLDVLFNWGGAIDGTSEKVNGLAVLINGLAVAIGALSDGTKAIGIGVSFLVGAFYDVAAAATYYIKMFTWGDVRKKLEDDYKVLTEQRDKYYAKAKEDALKFESDTQKALDNSVLNAEQANQKKVESSKKALQDILDAETKADQQLASNATKKAELEKQLIDARKAGNDDLVREILSKIKEIDDFENKNNQASIQRDKDQMKSARELAEASMQLNEGKLDDLTKEELLRSGIIAKIDEQGKLELSVHEDNTKANADRMAKLEALLVKEKELGVERVAASKEATGGIVQNEAFIASEKARLNDVANAALKAGNFEAYSQAKLDLDALGNAQAQANQQRVNQHQQANNAIQKIDASSFAMQKNHSDEQVRLSQVAAQAKKDGNFEAYSQAMLQIDQLAVSQTQADQLVSQSDLETLRKKEEITKEKAALAQQIIDSTNGIITKEQELQFVSQGLVVEYDEQGKATIKRSQTFSEAVKALGLDTSQALNLVSEEFTKSEESLDVVINGLQDMGAAGQQAADITYQAWVKWLETAKSQAEIDAAEQKLKEFGEQGKISTSQVEQGLIAIRNQAQELPDDIDPVTESFKRLGIETKENLKIAAKQAMMDFINVRDSGKATAEGVQKAYEKAAQAAALSGDAATIATANAAGASRNLQIQVDETGVASVQSMDKLTSSVERLSRTAGGSAVQGFKAMGDAAKDAAREAKNSIDEWNDALTAKSDAQKAEREKSSSSKAMGGSFKSYSRAEVLAELKSMGYDEAQAKKLAGSIMSSARDADRATMSKNVDPFINAQFNKLLGQGLTASAGSAEVQKRLASLANGTGLATMASTAPTQKIEFTSGQETATVSATPDNADALKSMLSELEAIKKSS